MNSELDFIKYNPEDYSDKLTIAVVNLSDNEIPEYETDGASGIDLRSNEELTLQPMEYKVIKTGLFFDIPLGYEMQIRPRSGLAAKFGITVLNSPGTIDSDYTGEVGIILMNLGKEPFEITKGDRIAQAVISNVMYKGNTKFMKVDEINKKTSRGAGGFGSTGVK